MQSAGKSKRKQKQKQQLLFAEQSDGTVRNQECLQSSPMAWCVTRSAHVDGCSCSGDENVFGEHKKQKVCLADKCDVWSHY